MHGGAVVSVFVSYQVIRCLDRDRISFYWLIPTRSGRPALPHSVLVEGAWLI